MASVNSDYIGLVAEHPRFGIGVIWRKDKYDRYSLKLFNGKEIGGLLKDKVRILSDDEVFNSDVYDKLKTYGLLHYVRSPYIVEQSKSNKEYKGPWICKKCFTQFELPVSDKVDIKCPFCGSTDIEKLVPKKKNVLFSNKDYSDVKGIAKLMNLINEGVEFEREIRNVKDLVDLGYLDKYDIFGKSVPMTDGLWESAIEHVWNSGNILKIDGSVNYDNVIKAWQNMYKKENGVYPDKEIVENLIEYFDRQNSNFSHLIKKLKKVNRKEDILENTIDELDDIKRMISKKGGAKVKNVFEDIAEYGPFDIEDDADEFIAALSDVDGIEDIKIDNREDGIYVIVTAPTEVLDEIDSVLSENEEMAEIVRSLDEIMENIKQLNKE